MSFDTYRWLPRGGALLLAGLTFAACNDKEMLTELAEDTPVFSGDIESAVAEGIPNGEIVIDQFRLIDFNTAAPDAFGRATGAVALYNPAGYIYVVTHGSATDPRSPVPLASGSALYSFTAGPEYWGASVYNFWFPLVDASFVDPAKNYAAALVRYGVDPDGELDTAERLLTGEITQPDALVVDGTIGGYAGSGSNFGEWESTGACREPMTEHDVFVLGSVSGQELLTDGAIDVITCAGPWNSSTFDADNYPFANNDNDFGAHQYNYVVVFEADASGTPILDRPIIRRQIGPDLNADSPSEVINNGYAPFPTAQMSDADLLAGPGGVGAPQALALEAWQLDVLAGTAYTLWLFSDVTGEWTQATFDIVAAEEIRTVSEAGDVTVTYEAFIEEEGATSFNGHAGPGAFRYTITLSDDMQSEGVSIGDYTTAVIAIGGDGAATPPDARPLWRQYTDQAGTADVYRDDSFPAGETIPLRFGTFRPNAQSYVYTPRGSGRADFFGDQARVIFRNLSRPPVGFEYVGWLVDSDTEAAKQLGGLTTLPPDGQSLADADVTTDLPGVTIDAIVEAALTTNLAEIGGQFHDFNLFRITLEPKASPEGTLAPNIILQGGLPKGVLAQAAN